MTVHNKEQGDIEPDRYKINMRNNVAKRISDYYTYFPDGVDIV